MSRRWSSSEKWDNPEHRKLSSDSKVLLEFMKDKCNAAGFLAIDLPIWKLITGIKGIHGAFKGLDWYYYVSENWVFLLGHLSEQCTWPLIPSQKVHQGILRKFAERVKEFPLLLEKLEEGEPWEFPLMELNLNDDKKGPEGPTKGPMYISSSKSSNKNIRGSVRGKKKKDSFGPGIPPTLEQVEAFKKESNINMPAQRFIDICVNRKWMVGKPPNQTHMQCWKGAYRTYDGNPYGNQAQPTERGGSDGLKPRRI